jgi:diaminohydroxyphosphoribosylaminopyrimidine deaminase/5-amino-6-(5-phosphoribosylamino)uracil reductase
VASALEQRAMARARDLAVSADAPRGPNPRVGCVLLREGRVVGEGHHRGAGTPHAEVAALTAAGGEAQGATAVVTLEPCSHTGRTPPCTDALIAAGVVRVVYAQPDDSARAGGGAARLASAGVDVEGGLDREDAESINPEWSAAGRMGRPFVTLKVATSLDGRAAAADGTSQWITSAAARRQVHQRRREVDAVAVGTGTVRADDPRLTARDGDDEPLPPMLQPLRVVVGTSDIDPAARVLHEPGTVRQVRSRDPDTVLGLLFEEGIRHVWLEGGPRLAGCFVAADVVDRLLIYQAGLLLGDGPAAIGPAGVHTLADAPHWRIERVDRLGPDVVIEASRAGLGTGESAGGRQQTNRSAGVHGHR